MLLCNRTPGCRKLEGHRSPCTVPVAPKPAGTAPDVRTAAQAEAERRFPGTFSSVLTSYKNGYADGAVWGAALVTPTREALVSKLYEAMCDFPTREMDFSRSWTLQEAEEYADAVLASISPPNKSGA